MANKINGIDAIDEEQNSAGAVTDGAKDAIYQAAMQKAGGVQEVETAGITASSDSGGLMGVSNDKASPALSSKVTEKLLSNSINMMAINNINMLNFNQNKNAVQQQQAQEAMAKNATDISNPVNNKGAADEMTAVAAQANTAVADEAGKDTTSVDTQKLYATGDSSQMQEAKSSGLAMGVKIEKPNATEKSTGSDSLVASNSVDSSPAGA
jgi:hypothetical protein